MEEKTKITKEYYATCSNCGKELKGRTKEELITRMNQHDMFKHEKGGEKNGEKNFEDTKNK